MAVESDALKRGMLKVKKDITRDIFTKLVMPKIMAWYSGRQKLSFVALILVQISTKSSFLAFFKWLTAWTLQEILNKLSPWF